MIGASGKITEKPFSSCKRERGPRRLKRWVAANESRPMLGRLFCEHHADGCRVADVNSLCTHTPSLTVPSGAGFDHTHPTAFYPRIKCHTGCGRRLRGAKLPQTATARLKACTDTKLGFLALFRWDLIPASGGLRSVTPPLLLEPAKQLTERGQRQKIKIQPKVRETGEYAGQVLGGARVDAHPSSRELALRRQHLVCRSPLRREPLYF